MSASVELVRVLASLFETGRRHQLFEIIGCVDDHEYTNTGLHDVFEPARKQGHMKHHYQIG